MKNTIIAAIITMSLGITGVAKAACSPATAEEVLELVNLDKCTSGDLDRLETVLINSIELISKQLKEQKNQSSPSIEQMILTATLTGWVASYKATLALVRIEKGTR